MNNEQNTMWTQQEAVELATEIEAFAPTFGCHVALTGGLLYKKGARKDCDLVLYRIRQIPQLDGIGLFEALAKIGLTPFGDYGFCVKCNYKGRRVDLLFPNNDEGDYEGWEDAL